MIDDKLHVSRKKDLLQAYRICLSVRPYSRQFYMTLNMKRGDINQNFIMKKDAQYLVYDFGNFFFQVKL